MKNIVLITFFGCIVFVANLFISEKRVLSEVEINPVSSQQLVLKENERRVLINELEILIQKNSATIDTIKGSN